MVQSYRESQAYFIYVLRKNGKDVSDVNLSG